MAEAIVAHCLRGAPAIRTTPRSGSNQHHREIHDFPAVALNLGLAAKLPNGPPIHRAVLTHSASFNPAGLRLVLPETAEALGKLTTLGPAAPGFS